MKSIRKQGSRMYLLVLAAHGFAICFGWETLRILSKLLLMPVLGLWLCALAGRRAGWLVYAGLLFAWLGDWALLYEDNLFFMLGMAGFIGTHTCYSIYFSRLQERSNSRLREAFAAAVILILLCVTMFVVLNPYLGSLRLPILFYMTVISVMAILAANTAANPALRRIALCCFIPGAALFVVSDALLAYNKFVLHTGWMSIPVMLSYGFAQFFLVRGFGRAARRF
ncbi:lysoplasmalogenase [Sediminibacterium soli]|uniref:lysoplasmalogenase n=1 Tax=Sediminibacterium soli TaxID=2698829 RepID=UPI001379DE49|nr:lysoplasmalogenase [Sediminibacterium soli]NCI46240.1 lysoplasmalogenase [Sediminibacterium soli]